MHLVRSWINKNTGKIENRKINTEEFEGVHSDVIQMYKIRKHLRLKNKSTTNEARLVYWRMNSNLNLDTEWSFHPQPGTNHFMQCRHINRWGVQRTMQQVIKVFYWPGCRKNSSLIVT